MFPASCGGDFFLVLAIHEAVNSSYKKKVRKERSRSAADWLDFYSPDVATTAAGSIGRVVRGSRCEEQARRRAPTNGARLRCKRSRPSQATQQPAGEGGQQARERRIACGFLTQSNFNA